MTANNKKPMTQAERQAFLGQTFTLREIFRILWDEKPAIYKNLTTGRFEDDGQQTIDNLEDRFRAEALEKLAAKPASLLREPVEVPAANPGKPIERNATNDQIAHVMLMHGTPEQQREALEYAGVVQPASKPEHQETIQTLMRFYSVETLEALVLVQNHHVERLQKQFHTKEMQPSFTRVREG